jgi:S-adenosylmethionine decarboxylase
MDVRFISVTDELASAEAPVGVHCILEMYQCAPALLNDADYMEAAIEEAARRANSTLLKLQVHQFEPQGVTAIALLAESHLSIHAWPERGYAAVDVFTCGEHTDPRAACHFLIERFEAAQYLLSVLPRGGGVSNHLPLETEQEAVLCL